jgi:lipoteichoic acid synthase
MDQRLKEIYKVIFMPLLVIYYETVLKAVAYDTVFNEGFVFMCLFSIPIGLVFFVISKAFEDRANKIILFVIMIGLTIYYSGQMLYYKIFSTFASLYFFIGAGKAAQFYKILLDAINNSIVPLLFLAMPLIVLSIYHKKINLERLSKNQIIRMVAASAAIQLFAIIAVTSSDKGMLSASYLYNDAFLVRDSIDKFGLLTTGRLDIKNILKNSIALASEPQLELIVSNDMDEEVVVPIEQEDENADLEKEEEIIEYNVSIDFDELIEKEGNERVKSLHEYFKSIQPTKKNKYTGMFKGKNLILITAEGFSPYAVREDLTPTLYKMLQEGFKFTDFYTPIWGVSTSDGEYVACTGLLPKEGIWSFYKSSYNYMPLCMGNQLKKAGYETFAYHNHYFDYYFRDKSHPNMGYTYKGLGNGLDVTETWPESDLEMIELTVDEYIDKQPFHTYYMTVSGHLQYNFGGNYIAAKNRDLVEHLDYSERVKAYLACNIELDKAMERLIARLDEKGIADDTLIAISPDHYPYGLTVNEISELAGHKVDTNFELYKGVFLLWSKDMESVEINEPCSSLDIIPTISNLMGVEYDSRLLMGADILSDGEPLVIFQDRSWITDKAYFNAKTGEVTMKGGIKADENYINEVSEKVKQKFKVSAMILDLDYYSKVLE